MLDASFDLSGYGVRLRRLPEPLRRRFGDVWHSFVVSQVAGPLLDVTVTVAGDRVAPRQLSGDEIRAEFSPRCVHFHWPDGGIEVGDDGRASLRLAPAGLDQQFYSAVTLLCAALAWRLPSVGAAVLHAAGVVLEGRAFVLIGPAGSGKSTWADIAKAAGALYVSDDIVFVDTTTDPIEVLGTPIRGNHPDPHGPARWPLAALLLPVHGAIARLDPVPNLAATARIVANLPFLTERLGEDERVARVVNNLVTGALLRCLTFAPDPEFLEVLRALPSGG